MLVGFSTGSLAAANFRLGLQIVAGQQTAAIELSALREAELVPLVKALDSLDLSQFAYISIHVPSRLKHFTETEVIECLRPVVERDWPLIVHPDIIADFSAWRTMGSLVCLENMDKRKSTGRTADELADLFDRLPEARLCFDIGHARQVDPTMCEAERILRKFSDRIRQIHLSLVNSSSIHEPLNAESRLAFQRVARWLPKDRPVILETPVGRDGLAEEMFKAQQIFR